MNFYELVFAIVTAYLLILVCSNSYGFFKSFSRDDTDGVNRSGLVIYTDNKTGVQYIGTALGGLTVRVDENGKPMKANQ